MLHRKTLIGCVFVPTVVLGVGQGVHAAPIILDDFNVVAPSIANVRLGAVSNGIPAGDSRILLDSTFTSAFAGLGRTVTLTVQGVEFPQIDDVSVGLYPRPGFLDYTSSSGGDGSIRLDYLSTQPVATGLAALQLDFLRYDLPLGQGIPINVSILAGDFTTVDVATVTLNSSVFPASVVIPLTSAPADLLAVSRGYRITIDPPTGADFRLDRVLGVVPEPTAAVFPLAVAGLLLRRQRTA